MVKLMQKQEDGPRIYVAGAGAIGLTLAARLMMGGYQVGVIARDEGVSFIKKNGLRLIDRDGCHHFEVAVGLAADFENADILFLCSKSHDLPQLALSLQHLITPRTTVVPVINGLPWWYFDGENGNWNGSQLRSADPDNVLKQIIPSPQVIGTTTIMTAERLDRGSSTTFNPLQMTLGELDDRVTPRLGEVISMLEKAGIATRIATRIRDAVWTKVVRNVISNPLTAITGATLRENFADQFLADISSQMLHELLPVVEAYGASLEVDPGSILDQGRKMGDFKTSMLQDLERGQKLELATICDAVIELARAKQISVPVIQAVSNIAHYRNAKQRRITISAATTDQATPYRPADVPA
nr:2-dehydropantoate 2-reductase [Rhizobium sp. Q54]